MFRWFVLVFALWFGVAPARAGVEAVYIGLHELCLEADAIVVGRIVALEDEDFEVEITRRIAGVTLPGRVKLGRFEDWTCGQRWAPYALGQELLLFLERSPDGKRLDPIGGTCEGEMPLIGGKVGCPYLLHDVPTVRVTLERREVALRLVPLAEFEEAIRFVRERFEYLPWNERSPGSIVPLWPMEEIEAFGRSSKVAWHLIDELYSSESWKGPVPDDGPQLAQESIERVMFPEGRSGAVRHLTCIGERDGGVEALATLRDPNRLVLVRQTRAGATSFTPVQIESFNGTRYLGACELLGDLDSDGELEFALNVDEVGLMLLSLENDGTSARWRELARSQTLREAGFKSGTDSFSDEMASLGDLDGDGTFELAVMVKRSPGAGQSATSLTFVLSIDRTGAVVRVLRWNDRTLPDDDPLWLSLAAVGDVDGDGVTDVALGSSAEDRMRGAVWIVFLERDGSVRATRKFSSLTGGFRQRFIDSESLGQDLAAPGDVDGDSIPDLLASSESGLWTLLLARDGSVRSVRRLRNPSDPEPPGSFLGDIAPTSLSLGRALACTPAKPGSPALVLSGAFRRADRRTGLLALSLAPDGTPTLR
jgi:hypothetical protein